MHSRFLLRIPVALAIMAGALTACGGGGGDTAGASGASGSTFGASRPAEGNAAAGTGADAGADNKPAVSYAP